LKKRCEIGIIPEVVSADMIKCIANYCHRNSDLRGAIELISSAVKMAEIEGSNTVEDYHIEKTLHI
jgi:Cdc6-like AAA superfamily ATPase